VYNVGIEHNWFDPKLAPSEKFTHRQADLPLMAIELPPQRLAAIRRRFQNRFFFRNYFRWYNARFCFSLLAVMLRRPSDAAQCFRDFFRTRRLDSFVESIFELHQRWYRSRLKLRRIGSNKQGNLFSPKPS
jgi:hypothetical protein